MYIFDILLRKLSAYTDLEDFKKWKDNRAYAMIIFKDCIFLLIAIE